MTGNRISYIGVNLYFCVSAFFFSVVENRVSQILTIHLNCQLIHLLPITVYSTSSLYFTNGEHSLNGTIFPSFHFLIQNEEIFLLQKSTASY